MPGSDDYESELLVVAAVLELIAEKFQLRNEAPLNFVSLRSLVDGVDWEALSRVEMNALRAPLTALPSREHKCVLDEADDFIDSDMAIFDNYHWGFRFAAKIFHVLQRRPVGSCGSTPPKHISTSRIRCATLRH